MSASPDWQSLISSAAVELFTRSGRLPPFRLARGDLIDLIAEISKVSREDAASGIVEAERHGFVALRCLVHCEPLSRAVVVDEWRKGE